MARHGKVANSSASATLGELFREKRLVIWDFDGTFCDTEPLHYLAYKLAFMPFGHEVREDEYYRRFTQFESGLKEEIRIYGLPLDEAQARDLFLEKKRIYAGLIAEGRAKPFPEILNIIGEMERIGLQWLIASNSDERQIRDILSILGEPFNRCFDVIGPGPALKKKPSGDVFREAVRRAGVQVDEALVLEDTSKGLAAAQDAGLEALLIHTRYNEDVVPEEPYAARLRHTDLLELFKTLGSTNRQDMGG